MDVSCSSAVPTKEGLGFISEEDYTNFSLWPTIEEYLRRNLSNSKTVTDCELAEEKVDSDVLATAAKGNKTVVTTKNLKPPAALELGPAMEYPHISRISAEDHKWLITEYEKLLSERLDGMDPAEANKFQELKSQVMDEQDQFQQFVYHNARFNYHLYNFINPEVMNSVKNILQSGKDCLVRRYPQYYTLQQTVGLAVGAAFPTDPVMKFEKMLLQRGEVPRLVLPDEESLSALNLTKTFGSASTIDYNPEAQELSEDSVAMALAKTHDVDIVISSSAFTTLVQSQQSEFQQQWELPVTIHEHEKEGADVTKKILRSVFIDNPLPKMALTPKEVNDVYFKRALVETCCKFRRRSSSQSASDSASNIRKREVFDENLAQNDQTSSSKRPRMDDFHNTTCDGDETRTKDVEMPGLDDSRSKISSAGKRCSSNRNETQNSTVATKSKAPMEIGTRVKKSVVYNLWTFGKLRVLICCSLEAYREISKEPPRYEYFSLLPKLEYQPTYGHERLTPTETAQWWAHAYIRPNTKILCGRINRYSSALMRIDELELGDVLNAGEGFTPAHAMKMVYKVFESLVILPSGVFLLSHSSGDIHSCLYRSVPIDVCNTSQEKRALVDLYNKYTGSETAIRSYKENEIPFTRIDTNLFLPINIKQSRFPATFPAVPAHELARMKKDLHKISDGPKKGKKKKGKKKNKRARPVTKRGAPSEVNFVPGRQEVNGKEVDACAGQGESKEPRRERRTPPIGDLFGHVDHLLPEQGVKRRVGKRAQRVLMKASLGDIDVPDEESPVHWEELSQRNAVSYTDLDDF